MVQLKYVKTDVKHGGARLRKREQDFLKAMVTKEQGFCVLFLDFVKLKSDIGTGRAIRDNFQNGYWSVAYSLLACFRMGRSVSASFHMANKSW